MMKTISILGSTGSIGTQSLDIIRENREKYRVKALTCGSNVQLLSRQIDEFHPDIAVTAHEEDAATLSKIHKGVEFFLGQRRSHKSRGGRMWTAPQCSRGNEGNGADLSGHKDG